MHHVWAITFVLRENNLSSNNGAAGAGDVQKHPMDTQKFSGISGGPYGVPREERK